jgi:hypothetical protein
MRGSMGNSLMGANGPGICTTAGGTGQALTADAAPFAIATLPPLLLNVNATGTAVLGKAGHAGADDHAVRVHLALAQHPVVLSNLEGISVQNVLAGYASGTFAIYTQWEWAEVVRVLVFESLFAAAGAPVVWEDAILVSIDKDPDGGIDAINFGDGITYNGRGYSYAGQIADELSDRWTIRFISYRPYNLGGNFQPR